MMIQDNQIYEDKRTEQLVRVIKLAMDWPSAETLVVVENLENLNKWCIPLNEFKERYRLVD